jgi:predicted outer membrane repeat protein
MTAHCVGLLVLVWVVVKPVGMAATYVVDPEGGGDFPTIQAAVFAAQNGDVVELTDGTFSGPGNRDIGFQGKAITIRSRSGNAEACVIDCDGSPGEPHRGVTATAGEGPDSRLQGVTIADGYASWGGAVQCLEASPAVVGCRFLNNHASSGGGALACDLGASPSLAECVFLGNVAPQGGAAASCIRSLPTFAQCTFVGNEADEGGGIAL